jgi:hypothetical protein
VGRSSSRTDPVPTLVHKQCVPVPIYRPPRIGKRLFLAQLWSSHRNPFKTSISFTLLRSVTKEGRHLRELDLPFGNGVQQMIRKLFTPVVSSAREEFIDPVEDLHRLQIHLMVSAKRLDQSGRLVVPATKSVLEDLRTDLWWESSEDVAGLCFC